MNRKTAPDPSPYYFMSTTLELNSVISKTQELCQVILDHPDVQNIRHRIDVFMADEQVRGQYDVLMMKGQALQQKQQSGVPLDGEEVESFESMREAFVGNPVARGFLDAQEEMHQLQQSVTKYVSKTFELGRVPAESDFEDCGSCGSGCGCH